MNGKSGVGIKIYAVIITVAFIAVGIWGFTRSGSNAASGNDNSAVATKVANKSKGGVTTSATDKTAQSELAQQKKDDDLLVSRAKKFVKLTNSAYKNTYKQQDLVEKVATKAIAKTNITLGEESNGTVPDPFRDYGTTWYSLDAQVHPGSGTTRQVTVSYEIETTIAAGIKNKRVELLKFKNGKIYAQEIYDFDSPQGETTGQSKD